MNSALLYQPPAGAFDETATEEDVYYCFRLLLGRHPNPNEWKGHSGTAGNRLADVVQSYLQSREFAGRQLLDRAFDRNLRLIQAQGFRIYANPDDLAVGKHVAAGVYERGLEAIFRRILRPGMGVVDLGANIGFFTMLAASLVGPQGTVLAVEPNIANVRLIEASRRANDFAHVTLAACAVGRATGLLALNSAYSNGTTSALGDHHRDLMEAQIVPAMPLAALVPANQRIDFIKIDVEGAEHLALSAARDLLARWRPIVATEFSPDLLGGISAVSGAEYLAFFEALGYRMGAIDQDHGEVTAASKDQVLERYARSGVDHIDLLMTPRPSFWEGWRRR